MKEKIVSALSYVFALAIILTIFCAVVYVFLSIMFNIAGLFA